MILDILAKVWLSLISFAAAVGAIAGFAYWVYADPDAPLALGIGAFIVLTLGSLVRLGFFDGPNHVDSSDPGPLL